MVPKCRQLTWPRVVACVILILLFPLTSVTAPGPSAGADYARVEPRNADHRYRIRGKVRLLLVWAGADDVGGARVTWRGHETDQSVALLIGSEPERAPGSVNEWGYVREHVAGDSTNVFGIRTVAKADSPQEADAQRAERGRLMELGVLCTNVSPVDARSRTARVHVARDATYRDVDRVLDIVERHPSWNGRHTARPANVAPGFLTALDRMMRVSVRQSDATPTCPRFSYVYKDAIYDLIPRHIDRVPSLRTRTGTYQSLLRADISVRNRATGSITGFSITYGAGGALAGVPIVAKYQPNWWFKVELELDDAQDVPPDPAGDASINQRIAQLCGRRAE